MGVEKERTLELTSKYLEWFKAQATPVQEAARVYVKLLLEKRAILGKALRGHTQGQQVS